MASKDELACVYAALILADDNVDVTSDKLTSIVKAAKVDVEGLWPNLFAKALEGVSLKDLIANMSSAVPAVGGGAPAGGATADAAAAAPADAPAATKEESEESDDDMGFGLFD
ncbi:PREDICTED: 60S acidic ribosomal protein P1-like [Priapulus caudatus]|uniref:Large ribosomal subunit protein P1 n=1 Tax=Priapulus caudatus TaxID=37621 RepID=A0ABM1EP99_PRICU|nr:PREDICTED: 60S acidic ribosomal protein P1-like [Priapulus caudatus]